MSRFRNRLAMVTIAIAMMSTWARADNVYLALGDSVTFGYNPSDLTTSIPSFADQGFVNPYADFLGSQYGVRPEVLNLGIVGELSTSFFDAVAPPGWTQRIPQLNMNYTNPAISQRDLMVSSIEAIHSAGKMVSDISLLFGANDIFYLASTPDFQNASQAVQIGMVAATVGLAQSNYLAVLDELAIIAPEAHLILPGYYNPFPTFAPEHAFYDLVLSYFNPLVQADALAYGATYVDLYTPFLGRELTLTNIAGNDVHPTQDGYTVIGNAMIGARAVPEPGSLVLLGTGIVGFYLRKRKAA